MNDANPAHDEVPAAYGGPVLFPSLKRARGHARMAQELITSQNVAVTELEHALIGALNERYAHDSDATASELTLQQKLEMEVSVSVRPRSIQATQMLKVTPRHSL